MKRTFGLRLALAVVAAIVGGGSAAYGENAGPALKIDVSAERHAISPDIYGMAYVDPVLAKEIGLPVNRWGGDATTRYNRHRRQGRGRILRDG
jgi:hypothetical protein